MIGQFIGIFEYFSLYKLIVSVVHNIDCILKIDTFTFEKSY